MLILWKARQKDPAAGYAADLPDPDGAGARHAASTAASRSSPTPAGSTRPGWPSEVARARRPARPAAPRSPTSRATTCWTGSPACWRRACDLAHLDTGQPLADAGVQPVTANAYLGGWGIARGAGGRRRRRGLPAGHRRGAASSGPAAWWHGWDRTDWDALAGAVVAGHVIECGAAGHAAATTRSSTRSPTGATPASRSPRWPPTAARVITKHPGTGGLVSVGTVTAQLLYEIDGPAYLNPDVVAHFDTVAADARTGRTGCGSPASAATRRRPTLKVAHQLPRRLPQHHDARADRARHRGEGGLGAGRAVRRCWAARTGSTEVDVRLLRFDQPDAPANEQATAHLRVTVQDPDPRRVGRAFSDAAHGAGAGRLRRLPHHHAATGRRARTACSGRRWCPADVVEHRSCCPTAAGAAHPAPHSRRRAGGAGAEPAGRPRPAPDGSPAGPGAERRAGRADPAGAARAGRGARSGDKGGNANVGLWARDDAGYAWLAGT